MRHGRDCVRRWARFALERCTRRTWVMVVTLLAAVAHAQDARIGWADFTAESRRFHTATLLGDGRVLVAGGQTHFDGPYMSLGYAEVYDPGRDAWTYAGTLTTFRLHASAVPLRGGAVLVMGGEAGAIYSPTTERYDPRTNEWTTAAPMATGRAYFTATVLRDGLVLAVGGRASLFPASFDTYDADSAEIYDPVADKWTPQASLRVGRWGHTATLLRDGRVLVTGGWSRGAALATAEIYDPVTGKWSPVASMPVAYAGHAATLLASGRVMVTGGDENSDTMAQYDPATDRWSTGPRNVALRTPTTTLLPDGRVLAIGTAGTMYEPLPAWRIFDPVKLAWTPVEGGTTRAGHTATLLASGAVLVMGGSPVYPAGGGAVQIVYSATPAWSTAGMLQTWRIEPSLTLLPSGKVLIAGGSSNPAMEMFDPALNTLTAVGQMPRPRDQFSAKLLRTGKVLMAGGRSGDDYVRAADLYDPATGQWTAAGTLQVGREGHSTTLLADGRVMIAGGRDASGPVALVEIFDPATGAWSAAGEMLVPRYDHSATLLPDGRVLLASGRVDVGILGFCEVFDPRTMTFKDVPGLTVPRYRHTALLLPDGRVRVLLGENAWDSQFTEVFDPALDRWSFESGAYRPRATARATLLSNDDLLITGGLARSGVGHEAMAEVAARHMANARDVGVMAAPRLQHATVRLLDGRVLVVGGSAADGATLLVEVFDPSHRNPAERRPAITSAPKALALPVAVYLTGSNFLGDSEATSGNRAQSAANVPIVRLQRLDDDATVTLVPASATSTTFMSESVHTAAKGWYSLRVTVDGITSDAVTLAIDGATPGPWPSATAIAVAAPESIAAGGAPATIVAGVSGVAPSGAVTFYDGDRPIGGCRDVALVAGGQGSSATCHASLLDTGPHALSARYGGDTMHFRSRSGVANVEVQPARSDCVVQMDKAEMVVNEGAPYATVIVRRSGFCPKPVNFGMGISDIDAGWGTFGFQNWLPWDNTGNQAMWAATISVQEVPGTRSRSFRVDLDNPENARLGPLTSTIVRITDNGKPPVVMPTGGRIASNPYGTPTVTGARLVGDRLVDLTSNVRIDLGPAPGTGTGAFEMTFDSFVVGAGNAFHVVSGAAGQSAVLRNTGPAPASIAGYVRGGFWESTSTADPVFHLASPAGVSILPGGFVESGSAVIVDALGSSWDVGGPIRNEGTVLGPTSLTLMAASAGGGGAHIAGAFNLYTFGNANNPIHGNFFLENGLRVFPFGWRVPITIAAYGKAPQFINLSVTGDATLLMPSSWPAGIGLPRNHRAVTPGQALPNYAPPAYGGGGVVVQVAKRLTLLPGASNDLVFPGAMVLKAGDSLDVAGVTLHNGWTSTGQSFQGVFVEAPAILNNGSGPIRVYTNDRNWINFSTFPRASVETWQLVKPSTQAYFQRANGIAPHLNAYSTSIELAARGECWTCPINSMAFP